MELKRRGFLLGLGALIAAPAIVRIENIMPVRAPKLVLAPASALDVLKRQPASVLPGQITYTSIPGTTVAEGKVYAGGKWRGYDDPFWQSLMIQQRWDLADRTVRPALVEST